MGKANKFGAYFKVEWLLTSIMAGAMTTFIAIRGFDASLMVAVAVGVAMALFDVFLLAIFGSAQRHEAKFQAAPRLIIRKAPRRDMPRNKRSQH